MKIKANTLPLDVFMTDSLPLDGNPVGDVPDIRLYVALPDGWSAHVKQSWDKEYCFHKKPGEDFFHLLMHGEIYVQKDDERLCLQCAFRDGVVTHDRLNWQKGGSSR
jgi:hypothetical protein